MMPEEGANHLDSANRQEFVDYYAEASLSDATAKRYRQILETILRIYGDAFRESLDVADIGCGAGTQCLLWASYGHRVHGVDISAPLIELGRQRAAERRLGIALNVGSADALPWADGSMDVCIMPELLEHVVNWRRCLEEAARVLRTRGVLFVTTTNRVCPVQEEFNLVCYSWYPTQLKRYFERLVKTERPDLANYATYPAVNWFTFRQLRLALEPMGFLCLDRFQTAGQSGGRVKQMVLKVLRAAPLLRSMAQVASPYTQVVAVRGPSAR